MFNLLINCIMCGKEFNAKRKHAKYCCSTCRSRAHYKQHKNKVKNKICIVCGSVFEYSGYVSNQKYCSKQCRNKSRYDRDYNNLNEQLKKSIRCRINDALSGRTVKLSESLGCTIEELKKHLESKFQEGMSWDNRGYSGWHIDHIIPLSSFDLSDPEELKEACHYTNLQPLWAKDNLKKGSKY